MTADGVTYCASEQDAGFGIYIHWPFCAAKCPYCDFNSHVVGHVDHARWARAFETALDGWSDLCGGREVRSVFFGGGTPSLMAPDTVAACLDRIARIWPLAENIEITLEANPTSVESARFDSFCEAGINRVSLGVQALNDTDLKRLGRLHSAAEAIEALEIARSRFSRVSFDLIYARQDQSCKTWQAELEQALSFAPDHLSLYQLTIEPGTAFHSRFKAGGLGGLPDEDTAADLFDLTQEICEAAGLPAYEVSNHARPSAESRHNLIYWRGGEWIGIGPGAHGRVYRDGFRTGTQAYSAPGKWLAEIESGTRALSEVQSQTAQHAAEEYLMMSLRLTEGSSLASLKDLDGPELRGRIISLLEDDLLWQADGRIGTTFRGRVLLNAVLLKLLSG